MRARQKAIESYGEVKVVSGVNSADNVQLIQMLFDGLVESLKSAEGQIKRGEIAAKSKSLARASKIVLGLQNATLKEMQEAIYKLNIPNVSGGAGVIDQSMEKAQNINEQMKQNPSITYGDKNIPNAEVLEQLKIIESLNKYR